MLQKLPECCDKGLACLPCESENQFHIHAKHTLTGTLKSTWLL